MLLDVPSGGEKNQISRYPVHLLSLMFPWIQLRTLQSAGLISIRAPIVLDTLEELRP